MQPASLLDMVDYAHDNGTDGEDFLFEDLPDSVSFPQDQDGVSDPGLDNIHGQKGIAEILAVDVNWLDDKKLVAAVFFVLYG